MFYSLFAEPNSFYHKIKFRLEAETLSGDYKILKHALEPFPMFTDGIILGPSVTQLNKKTTDTYFQR